MRDSKSEPRIHKFAGLAEPAALFWRRLHDYLNWERKNLRLVIDWIVALYIIVPFGLLAGRYYYGFWHGEIPIVMQNLPLIVLLLLPLLSALASRPILLLNPADAVFLRQRPGWLRNVISRAAVMFTVFQGAKAALIMALLLPFLRELYLLPWGGVAALYLAVWALHLAAGMTAHFAGIFRRERLKGSAALAALLAISALFLWAAVSGTAASLAAAAVLGAAAGIMMQRRVALSHHFEESAAADVAVRLRFAALLLARAVERPQPPKRRSLLLRRSGPLLPRFAGSWRTRQIADAALKSSLRENGYAAMYLRFAVISVAGVAVGPIWVGWVVTPLILLLFSMWLRGLWLRFIDHAFPPVASLDRGIADSACAPAVGIQMLPLAFALTACLGVKVFGAWWGALVFGLPGAAVGVLLAFTLSIFWHKKE
ncbi:ABC transporter permease [Saccharibacillus kuerlensis]|uniref:ABC-2 type transport system permease protein n=1 Tax=Saccharibacillus kuerlensis TaxID=459527 RepID=A0ABQ2LAR7_9BACL|nr:ABC transporter permease [Saccharibacillus kuerlensis]GGO08853.1 hypothetical protein GCM10010969_38690 [Saccharibacillus kuerlensis]